MRASRRKPKRVEISDQMAVYAIGPDQHKSANGFAGRPESLLAADFDAFFLRLDADLADNLLLFVAPIGRECVQKITVFIRPVVFGLPGRTAGLGENVVFALF